MYEVAVTDIGEDDLQAMAETLYRMGKDNYSKRFVKPVMGEITINLHGAQRTFPYPKERGYLLFTFVNADDAAYFKLRFGGV